MGTAFQKIRKYFFVGKSSEQWLAPHSSRAALLVSGLSLPIALTVIISAIFGAGMMESDVLLTLTVLSSVVVIPSSFAQFNLFSKASIDQLAEANSCFGSFELAKLKKLSALQGFILCGQLNAMEAKVKRERNKHVANDWCLRASEKGLSWKRTHEN